MNVTRRGVLGGAATVAALALTPLTVVAQVIEDVFRIQDDPENPTNFTYDLFAWAGSGYLAFRDGEVDVARWGDDNPPPAEEEPGPAQRERLYGPLVNVDLYDELVTEPRLYATLVRSNPMAESVVTMVLGLLAVFAYGAVKLRSPIIAGLLLFMAVAFVLAVLVDTSMVLFWVASAIGFVGLTLAVVEASR